MYSKYYTNEITFIARGGQNTHIEGKVCARVNIRGSAGLPEAYEDEDACVDILVS